MKLNLSESLPISLREMGELEREGGRVERGWGIILIIIIINRI